MSIPDASHPKEEPSKTAALVHLATTSDTSVLPTLDDAPKTQHLKSYTLLLALIVGAVLSAYLYGFALFQISEHASFAEIGLGVGSVVMVAAAAMWFIGIHSIDWWELVAGYWWLSMPIAGAAGLMLVMAQEESSGLGEKS